MTDERMIPVPVESLDIPITFDRYAKFRLLQSVTEFRKGLSTGWQAPESVRRRR